MKNRQKIAALFLTICLLLSTVPLNGFAAGRSAGASPAATGMVNLFNSDSAASVEINETNFPDANFRAYISENIDTDKDGRLSEKERAIYYLNVVQRNISSLQGIEFFPELRNLSCYSNALTSLDVSKNIALETLRCAGNALASLDVSKNTALTQLDCASNTLTSLDVSDCPELKWLNCGSNLGLSEVVLPDTDAGWYQGTAPVGYADQFTVLIGGGTVMANGGSTFLRKDAVSETVLHKNDGTGETKTYIMASNTGVSARNIENAFTAPAGKELASWNTKADGTGTSYTSAGTNITDGGIIFGSSTPNLYAQWRDVDPTTLVEINETNFPDANFRAYISGNVDTDHDGRLSEKERAIYSLSVSGQNIGSLQGIEFFSELQNLSCFNNALTSLDVSKNTALMFLSCSNNALTSLDVSKNTALMTLNCSGNALTSLDVSKNTALMTLSCSINALTSLDVSTCLKLATLDCSRNALTTLDVSKNTALGSLSCSNNALTSLDVSKNTALMTLSCSINALKSLDVSTCLKLETLDCSFNSDLSQIVLPDEKTGWYQGINTTGYADQFTEFTGGGTVMVSGGSALLRKDTASKITVHKNDGTGETTAYIMAGDGSIPVTIFTLNCPFRASTGKELTSWNTKPDGTGTSYAAGAIIPGRGTPDLYAQWRDVDPSTLVEINAQNFPDVNFRDYIKGGVDTNRDGWLSKTERAIYSLFIDQFNISSLQGIEFFPELTTLFCTGNNLTTLDVSKNTALTALVCSGNALTSLDVSKNTALTRLDCSVNALTSLDVSRNTALTTLDCSVNPELTEVVLPDTNAGWYQGTAPVGYADQFTVLTGGGTVMANGGSTFLRKDAASETVLHKNDGTGETKTFIMERYAGISVNIIKNAFTAPAGKELASWNTKADGTGVSYTSAGTNITDGGIITGSSTPDLYAQWRDINYSGFAVENMDVIKAADGLTVNADLVCTSGVRIAAYAAAYDSNGKMLGIDSLSDAEGEAEFSIALSAGSVPAKVKVFLTQQGSSAPICCAEKLF